MEETSMINHIKIPKINLSQQMRFWEKVDKRQECWLWLGACLKEGYGRIKINYENILVHRISYFLYYGKFDESYKVLHECDVRNCVQPKHLFLGTSFDNVIDCVNKGRHKSGKAYIPDSDKDQMKIMRRHKLTYKEIGLRLNVSESMVWYVINGHN